MKTKNLHKKLAALLVCLAMVFAAKAVTPTTALSLSDLQTQFAAAVASGVPATINIGAAITVNVDLPLVSTGDSITINMVPYGITVTAGTLTIGNKVRITSAYATAGALQANGGNIVINTGSYILPTTGNAIQALVGGTVTVNGGYIYSTGTSPVVAAGGNVIINGGRIIAAGGQMPAASAGMSILVGGVATPSGGTLTINGGYIATTTTGIARGVIVDYNGICIMNGGEVHSDMGGGRGISINGTNAGGKLYVNGGIVSATGATGTTGRAIQLDNPNSMLWVTGSPTITGGLEAIMVQKSGVAVIAGTPTISGVIGTNTTTAKLYDARGLSAIVATPGTGYYAASQTVTVTGGTGTINKFTGVSSGTTIANYTGVGVITPTVVTSSLVYTTDGTTPLAASTAYSAALTAAVPSVLNVSPLIDGTVIGSPTAFNYWTIGTPMTSAPTPTAPANKVASIFSDAYASADPGTNFFPGWGQKTVVSTIKIGATDNVLKYSTFDYEGTQIIHNLIVPDMKYMHIDVFTPNLTTFKVGPISPGPVETDFVATPIANQWNSYDIPVSTFTGVNMSNIFQMGTSGGSGTQTVYLDNIYFWTDAPADTQAPTAFTASAGTIASDAVTLLLNGTDDSGVVFYDITYGTTTVTASGVSGVQTPFIISGLTGSTAYSFSIVARDRTGNLAANNPIVVAATTLTAFAAAPVPTYQANKVISIFSDNYPSVMGSGGWEDWYGNTFSTVSLGGNTTLKDIATCCFGVSFTTPTIDVSSMNYLHVDIYPVTASTMTLGFIAANTAVVAQKVLTLTTGQWNSIDLSFADLKASSPTADFTQVKQMSMSPATGTFYLDNLLFYNDGTTGISTVISENGISCFPNPIINKLTISAKTEISQLTVRNLLGQSVKTAIVNGLEKTIDLSDVASGNYLLTLKLANGQSSTQKIVKL
jgi:hypothetical protein